ncbi:ATP-binding protein [Bailinhaonella thermotolerans]|uniref:ATP-binding protein n=1 Tax=Bailinhaonella thermotolerans TaxID=1070861 RepID=A0A3A4BGJ1_9ACTN|nr:ATP-binding protein [Bailinhaonella thermotolerans]RJL30422.1 ATP-binding protein [Bailinhaonella thermotolerans]
MGVTSLLDSADPGHTVRHPIGGDLAAHRQQVREFLAPLDLGGQASEDFVLAVDEAIVNVLEHAGGRGTLILTRGGGEVSAQVCDRSGRLIPDDAGLEPPSPGAPRGYGLYLIRQFCDDVRITRLVDGTCVQMTLRL